MRLYLDACAIIYAIEGLPQYRNAVLARVAQAESSAGGVLITSRLSCLECRVKPLRDRAVQLLEQYEAFFNRPPLVLVEISSIVVERATQLRAEHGFKTPDAIHLATALEEHADVFLSGDASLARCPGVRVDLI